MASKAVYRVMFFNNGEVFEVYAREIFQSELAGFVELEELVFGDRSQMVVDPGEEKLKTEFAGVKRSYVPFHSVIRIDEVEQGGAGKIRPVGDKVTPFPVSITPQGD